MNGLPAETSLHPPLRVEQLHSRSQLQSTPSLSTALHEAAGEACDYVKMKAEVLADLATAAGNSGFDWIDIDLSWLEWPDIDLSGIFDWFDFS